jgi:biopolymer transport protein TolQ
MDIKWLLSFQMTGWFCAGIYIVLILLSLLSWTLIFQKLVLFRRVRQADELFRYLNTKGKMPSPYQKRRLELSARYLVIQTAADFRSGSGSDLDRVEEAVKVNLNDHFQKLHLGLPILATITSVAPFLGLLGTVWGIMMIFSRMHGQVAGVSEMVAPGVAQALITTIGGLIVAIPALFFYNYFSMILHNLTNEAENFTSRTIYLS